MFVFLSFLMNLCGIGSVVVSSEGGVDLNFGFVMFFRLIFTNTVCAMKISQIYRVLIILRRVSRWRSLSRFE